jgi:hypothetical protein
LSWADTSVATGCKIIVGRNNEENQEMLSIARSEDWKMQVIGYGSPITVIRGNPDNAALCLAASLCARYSDGKHLPNRSDCLRNDNHSLKATPADNKPSSTTESKKIADAYPV